MSDRADKQSPYLCISYINFSISPRIAQHTPCFPQSLQPLAPESLRQIQTPKSSFRLDKQLWYDFQRRFFFRGNCEFEYQKSVNAPYHNTIPSLADIP